jgi:hypothetical protein
MSLDKAVIALCAVVFLPSAVRLFKIWFYELRFYREKNWNFSINSKYSGIAKWGDAAPKDEGISVSNRARVLFVVPTLAFGFAFGAIAAIFFFFWG